MDEEDEHDSALLITGRGDDEQKIQPHRQKDRGYGSDPGQDGAAYAHEPRRVGEAVDHRASVSFPLPREYTAVLRAGQQRPRRTQRSDQSRAWRNAAAAARGVLGLHAPEATPRANQGGCEWRPVR